MLNDILPAFSTASVQRTDFSASYFIVGIFSLVILGVIAFVVPKLIRNHKAETATKARKEQEFVEFKKNPPVTEIRHLTEAVTEAYKDFMGENPNLSQNTILRLAFWKAETFRYNYNGYLTEVADNSDIRITEIHYFDGLPIIHRTKTYPAS